MKEAKASRGGVDRGWGWGLWRVAKNRGIGAVVTGPAAEHWHWTRAQGSCNQASQTQIETA